MIASDLNNPAFSGASNPDSMLHVEFYNHAALDTWATKEKGIKTYVKECPYIRIAIPGNDKTLVERPATGNDSERFPRQWMNFQMQTGMIANAENVPGWQLDDWKEINGDQLRSLKYLRFYTVEQLAGANDAQVQGIGMGGLALREQAKKALADKNAAIVNSAVAERDNEIAELKAQMAQLMAMVSPRTEHPSLLAGEQAEEAAERREEATKRRVRPAKDKE
jgi:hypothetical protein